MSQARYIVGDVLEVLRTLPDDSVDLVLTSPPFWNLRSYLPQEHPDKGLEMGSEATPGAFLDALLDVVEECRRVLAPHGSLCLELADSYFGSGGAGGDYAEGGWRNGQPKFGGSASKGRESKWSLAQATWLAGIIDAEGSVILHKQDRAGQSPSYRADVALSMMDRQVCDRAAEITGVGNVTRDGRKVYQWHVSAQQARYVLLNIWPHLLIKQRQALAAIELQRHIEETKRRGRYAMLGEDELAYREMIREYVCGLNARGEDRGKYVPTWEPPIPDPIHHEAVGMLDGTPMNKSLSMIPEGLRMAMAYGVNPWTGRQTPKWRIRNVIRWVRSNPPVGALADKFRNATSEMVVACTSRTRYFDLDAVRTPHTEPGANRQRTKNGLDNNPSHGWTDSPGGEQNPAGAPPLDWWAIPTEPYVTPYGLVVVPSGETVRRVRVPLGAPGDGIQRTTSPDCPEHGSLDPRGSSGADGGRGGAASSHIGRTAGHPAPAPVAGSPPTFWSTDRTGEGEAPADPAATGRSTSSRRTDPAPSTCPVGTPSERTAGRTGDTSTGPSVSGPCLGTPESSTGEACPPAGEPETEPRTSNTPGPSCTCSYWVEVSVRSEDTSDYAGWPDDWWEIPTEGFKGSHYATWPRDLLVRPIKAMCPERVCRVCGEPSRRVVESQGNGTRVHAVAPDERTDRHDWNAQRPQSVSYTTLGWTDCTCTESVLVSDGLDGPQHLESKWRPGVVLDPFAGSGTTGAVATGHGRDAVLVDLDERNADLALERCGLFLTIEHFKGESVA